MVVVTMMVKLVMEVTVLVIMVLVGGGDGGDGQGSLVCCSPWGYKELDMTE